MPRKPKERIECAHFVWTIFERGGVFYADGRGCDRGLGKQSLGTKDRAEALERLKALDLHMAVMRGLVAPEAAKYADCVSIVNGWQAYLDHAGRSAVLGGASSATVKRYKAVRDKHQKFCAKHEIATWAQFDKRCLEKYGEWLTKLRAYRTVYFELTLLKSVNAWLIEQKELPADARIHCPLTKAVGTDTYCYTRSEVAAMIAHCRANSELHWLADVVVALAHLGVRIGELAGLRWKDVDLAANVIVVADERTSRRKQMIGTVRTTKGKRSRTIPIHPRLRELLVGLSRQTDGWVFHAPRGGRLRPNNTLHAFVRDVIEPLQKTFPTAKGEIGFEHGRLHSFRHFFVSQAFLGGASEGEIREWVGHADSKMVEHYRHLGRQDAARRMGQITFVDPDAEEQRRAGNTE